MSVAKKIKKKMTAREKETLAWSEVYMARFKEALSYVPGHCLLIQQIPNGDLISMSSPMPPELELKFLYFQIERVAQSQGRKPSEVAFEALMEFGNEESQ